MINVIWPRSLKAAYRKEPLSAFILTVGAVDMVIGGVGQRPALLSLGVMVVTFAALSRWLQRQRAKTILAEESPARYYLPPSSSRPPLPLLSHEKNRH